jgi:2-C-methyl-D-erythritol 4-phosphate cytidylyltransferase
MPERPKAQKLAVVIPAGGVGTRFGGRLPKQFIKLGRVPILTETIGHFTRHPAVIAIVVAAPEIHVERTRRVIAARARR